MAADHPKQGHGDGGDDDDDDDDGLSKRSKSIYLLPTWARNGCENGPKTNRNGQS